MARIPQERNPLLIVTGATGNLGRSIVDAFAKDYRLVGLDRDTDSELAAEVVEVDITSPRSVRAALEQIGEQHGCKVAAVIHLIAYFDFSGEHDPLYGKVNVEGTRNLLGALKDFEVERFIYASTILVHQPRSPGLRIDETTPIDPQWAYPQSKWEVEELIRSEAAMPYALLRLSGIYDEQSAVPVLSHQIARILERKLQSHLYCGPLDAGQSMLHREDMIDAVRRTLERRTSLPRKAEILVGEPIAVGYDTLQKRIGELIHGEEDWETFKVPAPLAKLGAHLQDMAEPLVPDSLDKGEAPFIQPFMIDLSDDHYALDITRAENWLGWRPRHRLENELPAMIANLKADPAAWYERNGITPPQSLTGPKNVGPNG